MKDLKVMYSSKSDEWTTPQAFYDEINKEFHFDLDAAANDANHKCEKYFTLQQDGLTQNWGGVEYFVTHLIVKLKNGLQKLFMNPEKIKHWLFY